MKNYKFRKMRKYNIPIFRKILEVDIVILELRNPLCQSQAGDLKTSGSFFNFNSH